VLPGSESPRIVYSGLFNSGTEKQNQKPTKVERAPWLQQDSGTVESAKEFLPQVAADVMQMVPCRGVCIALLDKAGAFSQVAKAGNFPSLKAGALESLVLRQFGRSTASRGSVRWRVWPRLSIAKGFSHVVGVPLVGDTQIGVLMVGCDRRAIRNRKRISNIMRALADNAVATIVNARLLYDVKEVRNQQRQLLWQLMHVQEEERRRIAGEIHDRLGRRFFEFYYGVRQCQELLGDRDRATADVLSEMVENARECAEEIREFINELRPSVLDDFGFVEALKEQVSSLKFQGDFEVALRLDEVDDKKLSPAAHVALFRAFQEAVVNARKHASARKLSIELANQNDGHLRFSVHDDGCGFDPGKLPQGHFGLLYMRERIEACGGQLNIRSAPTGGTEIQVIMPQRR
jgi:signal transduction histidine kinase